VPGRLFDVRPSERAPVAISFVYFFTLLGGYTILRPIRDEMGVAGGKLEQLFSITFAASLLFVPLFSAVVARFRRFRIVPITYAFFVLNLVAFFVLFRLGVAPKRVAQVFFVWASVYNLFITSVFWSYMADVFAPEQGKRLFGVIAAGGSAGAILGPLLTSLFVELIGIAPLVLVSAGFLSVAAGCAILLGRHVCAEGEEDRPVGGGILAGFRQAVASPYLGVLVVMQLLYTTTSTFLYFQQQEIVRGALSDPAARTALFATRDLVVNTTAVATQLLITGALLTRLGLGVGLAIVPVVTFLGFAGLAVWQALAMVIAFDIARRAMHFAVDRPARENLFTVVSRAEKYKAKSFIDTVVYRGGDAASGWLYTGLGAIGLGVAGTAACALPLALAWLASARYLAKQHRVLGGGKDVHHAS
jgi:ATP:ADP antiporter, AAA family